MNFKEIKLGWIPVLKQGIFYSQVNWTKLSVSDKSSNLALSHGRFVSPTYIRKRTITIEWIIDREENENEAVEHLQNLFTINLNSLEVDERELYIKDIYDKEWILQVKIKEPLILLEDDWDYSDIYYKFRVVLESTFSPIYRSFEEEIVDWTEWFYWWCELWWEFPLVLSDYYNSIICKTSWNVSSPARFEIKAIWNINSPLIVKNLTNKTFFSLDINANFWDEIVIDWNDFTATKNWENIKATILPWRTRQEIKWETIFWIEDNDWGVLEKDIQVKIYFNNSML